MQSEQAGRGEEVKKRFGEPGNLRKGRSSRRSVEKARSVFGPSRVRVFPARSALCDWASRNERLDESSQPALQRRCSQSGQLVPVCCCDLLGKMVRTCGGETRQVQLWRCCDGSCKAERGQHSTARKQFTTGPLCYKRRNRTGAIVWLQYNLPVTIRSGKSDSVLGLR